MEADYKNTIKIAKRTNKKLQNNIIANREKTIKGSLASKADEEALLSANVAESNLSLTDLFLLGKQID
jgi:lactam utilization protein B